MRERRRDFFFLSFCCCCFSICQDWMGKGVLYVALYTVDRLRTQLLQLGDEMLEKSRSIELRRRKITKYRLLSQSWIQLRSDPALYLIYYFWFQLGAIEAVSSFSIFSRRVFRTCHAFFRIIKVCFCYETDSYAHATVVQFSVLRGIFLTVFFV